MESPTTRSAGGLDFSAIGGEIQRHGSALIGGGVTGGKAPGLKTPNKLHLRFGRSKFGTNIIGLQQCFHPILAILI